MRPPQTIIAQAYATRSALDTQKDVRVDVVGMPVSLLDLKGCADRIISWASASLGGYVCVANAHMAVEARRDASFQKVVSGANLVTSDGMSLVYALRLFGVNKTRVCGRDLTDLVLMLSERNGVKVGFLGGRPHSLSQLLENTRIKYPRIDITYFESPPFEKESADAIAARTTAIQRSGTQILFVGLGCPKQERWMAAHSAELTCISIGVGAVFDFFSGEVKIAPALMQRVGLEWLHRLSQQPRRLFKRYFLTNTWFLFYLAADLFRGRSKIKLFT